MQEERDCRRFVGASLDAVVNNYPVRAYIEPANMHRLPGKARKAVVTTLQHKSIVTRLIATQLNVRPMAAAERSEKIGLVGTLYAESIVACRCACELPAVACDVL